MICRAAWHRLMATITIAAAMTVSVAAEAASSGPAYERGLRMAERRGLANTACFANVFSDYAVQSRRNRWILPRTFGAKGTKRIIYAQDMWQRCRIAV